MSAVEVDASTSNTDRKNGTVADSWKGKCSKKWNLNLSCDESAGETEWKKYYRERKALDQHLERIQSDEEMLEEVFDGDDFFCTERDNDYCLRILKEWRESVDIYGMANLSNHLYPLKCSIELDGNNEPRDIHFRSRFYSPCSSNSADLDFLFHYRPRCYTVEDSHSLQIRLRSTEDTSKKALEAIENEDPFSKKWLTFLKSENVEKGHRRTRREYIKRKIVAVPTLLEIEQHLFGSGINKSEDELAAKGDKKGKKQHNASPSESFPRGPRDVCNIILSATGFDLLDDDTYPLTMRWIKKAISENFPEHYLQGKVSEKIFGVPSGRQYITETVDMYNGEDDYDDDDVYECDEDQFDMFGGRDTPGCRSM